MRPLLIAINQLAVVGLAAVLTNLYVGESAAKATWFGGLTAVVNTLMLAWRMRTSAGRAEKSPGQELAGLVRSSMERFFMVALLVAAGLGWLKLLPAPLLLSFVLGQVVMVVSTTISGIEKQ